PALGPGGQTRPHGRGRAGAHRRPQGPLPPLGRGEVGQAARLGAPEWHLTRQRGAEPPGAPRHPMPGHEPEVRMNLEWNDVATRHPAEVDETDSPPEPARPGRHDIERAVRTLIAASGDDPNRAGVLDTPRRVARAYREWFAGYAVDPRALLSRVFDETEGYDETVLLRDIPLVSTCEHHLAPIVGRAHVAYRPAGRVVG